MLHAIALEKQRCSRHGKRPKRELGINAACVATGTILIASSAILPPNEILRWGAHTDAMTPRHRISEWKQQPLRPHTKRNHTFKETESFVPRLYSRPYQQ
jgi:hypothetical protein